MKKQEEEDENCMKKGFLVVSDFISTAQVELFKNEFKAYLKVLFFSKPTFSYTQKENPFQQSGKENAKQERIFFLLCYVCSVHVFASLQ